MKHKMSIERYNGTMEDLVEDIGNLNYSALENFFILLSNKNLPVTFSNICSLLVSQINSIIVLTFLISSSNLLL